MNNMVCKKGDSSDAFEISVLGVTDYTNYRGEMVVLDPDTHEVLLGKLVLSPEGNKFHVFFLPSHTEALGVGQYTVVFEVIKEEEGVVVFRREVVWPLKITSSLIN